MKKLLFALCLVTLSAHAFAVNVPHQLTGAVIVSKVPGSAIETPTINYNARMNSYAACTSAVQAIEHATFSPYPQVTNGGKSEGDIQKFVFLQCLPVASN